MPDHGYPFFGFSPVGTANVENKDIESGAGKDFSQYWFSSLALVPLEQLNWPTYSTSSRENESQF